VTEFRFFFPAAHQRLAATAGRPPGPRLLQKKLADPPARLFEIRIKPLGKPFKTR
jgi:hypothetical protein